MKKYFLLIAIILFSINANSASIVKFQIQSQYLSNSTTLRVSRTKAQDFKVNVTIDRNIKSYGYERIDWILTVVYTVYGEKEIELSSPMTIVDKNFSSNPGYLDLVISATIPANKAGGRVQLKYSTLTYNNEGNLINDRRPDNFTNFTYAVSFDTGVNPEPGADPDPVRFNPNNLRLYTSNGEGANFRLTDYMSGGYLTFGKPEWKSIDGITSLNNFLYVISTNSLHKVDPSNGSWVVLGTVGDWQGTAAITKSTTDGYLYIVSNNRIHKVNPNNGDYTLIGQPEWGGVSSIVEYNDYLYLVENEKLYRVDKTTGAFLRLGNERWEGTRGIASDNQGSLYIISNNYLHKVNSADGSYVLLGPQVWDNTSDNGIIFYKDSLYIVRSNRLYAVDKQTGSYRTLGKPDFNNTAHITIL